MNYSDFYFYTSSSATSNYNIVATSANSSSYSEDTDPNYGYSQTDYYTTYTDINITSAGALSLVFSEDDYIIGYSNYIGDYAGYNYQNSASTPITTLTTNKWYRCKVLFDAMGIKSIGIFSGTNINGITPDYTGTLSTTYVIGSDGNYVNNRVFGQTNGVVASPQIGGYIDDLILSDSPIVRKKPFVGIAKP